MSDEKKHIDKRSELSGNPLDLVTGTRIDWGKSKEQVWLELEKRIESSQPVRISVIESPWVKLAMAAAFALLVGISVLMQLYTKSLTVPAGQHSDILLPDHSRVRLNAQTTLSYKPLKWKFMRHVKLEGEAFFEVKPGKKFEVISDHGKTVALGTSFNIYSRNDDYQVTCVTGKVRVTETQGNEEIILLPGQKAGLNPLGTLEVQSNVNTSKTLSWLEDKLSFTSIPLQQVFEEIGRQYGVVIRIPENLEYTYTGTFSRHTSVEQTLNLVCKPFNLRFSLKSKDEYIITRNI